jgi:large subunit ribosomal protein L35
MPKMKSHKASRKRIRLTPNGKLMRTQCGVRHILADRSPKRMRNLHKLTQTTTAGYKRRARFALLTGQNRKSP